MVQKMRSIRIPGVEVFVEPVKEHRFVVVFRGAGPHDLGDAVNDTGREEMKVRDIAELVADAMGPAAS